MPELSEYRQRFIEYHAELMEDGYRCLAGRKAESDRDHIRKEYSDLFELSAIEELGEAIGRVAEYRENERSSIRRLKSFAIDGYVAAQAASIDAEIDHYLRENEVVFEGARISLSNLDAVTSMQRDAKKRRELAARRADHRAGAADLFAERVEILKRSISAAGYETISKSRRDLIGSDPAALAGPAETLLSRTENDYIAELSAFLPAETGVSIDEAIESDLDHLEYYSRFDAWLTADRLNPLYRELCEGLGFKAEHQTNLNLSTISENAHFSDSVCLPVRVPDVIRLIAAPAGGQRAYRRFFKAAGRAQNFAWTSGSIAPELRYLTEWGDSALSDCWAGLVARLVSEEHWLQGSLGFMENSTLRAALRLIKLIEVRRHAGMHLYQLEILESEGQIGPPSAYVNRMHDALKVSIDASGHLANVSPAYSHAGFLRGAALENQLRDFLKTHFGSRWWTSRKAGEMIIDLWNTGQRYSAEGMAALIGLGDLDYDLLAAEITG